MTGSSRKASWYRSAMGSMRSLLPDVVILAVAMVQKYYEGVCTCLLKLECFALLHRRGEQAAGLWLELTGSR